jgi:arylsulfatase
MRIGPWKLVAKGANSPWELYNLENDRTEWNNLAEQEPERLEMMAAQWEAWAKRAHVKPWPWAQKKKGA